MPALEPGTDHSWLPAGFTVHDVDTNGTTISTAVGGAGPTMVLLHGWPQTGRAWRHVMGHLAERPGRRLSRRGGGPGHRRRFSNPGTFTQEDLAAYARAHRGEERLRGGFAQYRDLLQDGQENRTLLQGHPLTMPVLAIGGGDRTGAGVADALRPYAPRLTGLVAPTGHFVVEEDPTWFLQALTGFRTPVTEAGGR